MDNWFITFDHWALYLILTLLLPLLYFKSTLHHWFSKRYSEDIYYSKASRLESFISINWKLLCVRFLPYVLIGSIISLSIAFVNPRLYSIKDQLQEALENTKKEVIQNPEEEQVPAEGLGIYMVLDCSGSMSTTVGHIKSQTITRMDLLKALTERFLSGEGLKDYAKRSHDMIGLVSFARIPQIRYPLTLDRNGLIKEVRQLEVVKREEEDGTAIGYALYKTIHYLKATQELSKQLKDEQSYLVRGNVIILVTDGLDNPSPLDSDNQRRHTTLDEAAQLAKDAGIHIYIINIESRLNHPMYGEYLRNLRKVSAITSGQFYLLNKPEELSAVYEDIEKREKSKYKLNLLKEKSKEEKDQESAVEWKEYDVTVLAPYLLQVALLLIFTYILIEYLFIKRLG
ncbi:MAG: VWA domain-containing protein [Chlamydiales bacterium]|nr:VWA domain-containing protein [Chlamydiales bacterium]